VGGVKEPGQSEEGGQVQLRQETVQLVQVVGDDRWLRWMGGARGGARIDYTDIGSIVCSLYCRYTFALSSLTKVSGVIWWRNKPIQVQK
jgi:hypothetical protein